MVPQTLVNIGTIMGDDTGIPWRIHSLIPYEAPGSNLGSRFRVGIVEV